MLIKPHSSATRKLEVYSNALLSMGLIKTPLELKENGSFNGPGTEYSISKKVRMPGEVMFDSDISYTTDMEFGVLWLTNVGWLENRVTRSLEDSRITKQNKEKWYWEKTDQQEKREALFVDDIRQRAKSIRKIYDQQMDQYNLSQMPDVDPTRKRKEFEDRTGIKWGSQLVPRKRK